MVFRGLIRRLSRASGKPTPKPDEGIDPWLAVREAPAHSPFMDVIGEIERTALAVYAEHGLPTEAGHYVRAPVDDAWQFVAEHLTPEQRWAFLDEYPPQDGWTFTDRPGLGHHARKGATVMEASRILRACILFREMPEARANPDILEKAIRLGAAWSCLTDVRAAKGVSLSKPGRSPGIARRKTRD